MARVRITPELDAVVDFSDAGVRLPRRQRRSGGGRRHRIRRFAGEVSRDEVWFLRNATFAVAPGTSLAVVGHKGSGRDQILRLAAGTLLPDEGDVRRSMPIVPIIGLGGALSGGYTVRQNIYLVGGLVGMAPDEVGEKLPGIVERAGMHKVLDKYLTEVPRPARGRLIWSIAMASQARAFAISQALVVGQPAFQQECWETVEAMKADGVTFLVVSDRTRELLRFCDDAVLLDNGQIVARTTVEDAIERLKSIPPPKEQVHFVLEEDDDDDDEDLV